MRVLVTGSRAWRDYKRLRHRLAEFPEGTTIVHGAASGADAMAHVAASALGFTPEPHWPDYETFDVADAPLRRNEYMVELGADLVLAFPTTGSRGTWHCVQRAKAAGLPTEVVR